VSARGPVRVDPRLRPDHQRARDAAPARRPDLSGDVHADLRRVPAAPQLAGGVRPGPAAHRDGARARLPFGPLRPPDGSSRVRAARVRAWRVRAWGALVFGLLLLPRVVLA